MDSTSLVGKGLANKYPLLNKKIDNILGFINLLKQTKILIMGIHDIAKNLEKRKMECINSSNSKDSKFKFWFIYLRFFMN